MPSCSPLMEGSLSLTPIFPEVKLKFLSHLWILDLEFHVYAQTGVGTGHGKRPIEGKEGSEETGRMQWNRETRYIRRVGATGNREGMRKGHEDQQVCMKMPRWVQQDVGG